MASGSALASAAVVALMFGVFALTGIGQDPLQYMHPVAEYTAILLQNPPVLRASIGLDNLFIVLYSTMFLSCARRRRRGAGAAPSSRVGPSRGVATWRPPHRPGG
jgi:hypothetical protein